MIHIKIINRTLCIFNDDLIIDQNKENEQENYSHEIHNLNSPCELPETSYSLVNLITGQNDVNVC